MKTFIQTLLVFLCSLDAGMALAQGPARGIADRLERPSRMSPMAPSGLLTDIQAVGNQSLMVGESGHVLLYEVDGSVSQAKVPVDLLLTAVHFVDPLVGWAVGHDGVILHSSDGGRSWNKQLDGAGINQLMSTWAQTQVTRLQAQTAQAPDDASVSHALDDALFALDDIQAGSANGPSRPLLGVWFKNVNEGWVVGAYGIFLHTLNGGLTWQYVAGLENPDRLHLNAVLGLTDGSLLVAGEGGRLHRSIDGGEHWTLIESATKASLYKLMAFSDEHLLALGFGGTLLGSDDRGMSWKTLPVPTRNSLYGGSQLADGSLLLTGQSGVLLRSSDGQHFQLWQVPGKKNSWLGSVEVADKRLLLIGNGGLQIVSLAELKEQRQ